MKQFISLAVLALISGSQSRKLVQKDNMNIQLGFADGVDNEDVMSLPSGYGVRFVQQKLRASSDPIKGSLGWPAIPMENLTPEQQFEQGQRNMKIPDLKDDPEQVTDTLKSIEQAEGIVGGKFPDPTSPAEIKKMIPTPNYTLADSDDEADDAGDSTLETRRSVQWAENNLKQRWFINAQEKRSFEEKVANGQIRGEVLDFTNKDDNDMSASSSEIDGKADGKKAKAVASHEESKKAEEKAKAEEGKEKKDPIDEKAEKEEADDKEAKDAAVKSLDDQDKAEADKGKKPEAGAEPAAEDKAAFVPAELQGLVQNGGFQNLRMHI